MFVQPLSVSGRPLVVGATLAALLLAIPAAWAGGGAGAAGTTWGGAGGGDSAVSPGEGGNWGSYAGGGGGAGVTGGAGGNGIGPGGAGGTVAGGHGADGQTSSAGGGGGGGAHGTVSAGLPTINGAGGDGGNGGAGFNWDGGGGGAGGYGAVIIGAGDKGNLSVDLYGGTGGNGGASAQSYSVYGGNGGSGGIGLLFADPGQKSVGIDAGVSGGRGGNGGIAIGDNDVQSKGGAGGAGLVGNDLAITVGASGAVAGGNGGACSANDTANFANAGLGGVGIMGAGLTVVNGGTISGGLSGDGTTRANAITFTGGDNRLELWAGAAINGTVDATAGSNTTLAFGGGNDGTFDLSLIGALAQYRGFQTIEKSGSGIWTFTGTSLAPMQWAVDAGRLVVNSSVAGTAVTVQSGGVLGGSGTIGVTVIQSGGTLAPGNSIGTLNTGALTYHAGAIHEVELAAGGNTPGTHNDLTLASGLVTIDSGAILRVAPENGTDTGKFYDPGLTYTIITSTVGIDGTFGSLIDDYLFLNFVASYDANNVYLTSQFADVSFCLAGSTANQCAASQGVQSSAPGAVYTAILNLTDEDVARAAFDQLSGEIHASAKGMLLDDSGFVRDAVNDRLRSAFGAPSVTALPILAYGEGGAELVAADTERFALWGNAFGSWGNNDGDGNAAAFDRSIGGLLMGGDALVGDAWRVGLMTGFSRSSFDVDDRNSSGDATSYYLGAYGGSQWGAVSLRTGAAYSWNSLDTRRAVSFPGLSEVLSADYDAGTAQIFGEAGHRFDTAAASFEPFANLAYVNVRTDAFTETGGSAALSQASSNTDATFTTLGIRASGDFALGTVNATARGMVGWRHAFGDVTPVSSVAFAGSDAFTIAGVPIARDAAVLEAGFDFDIAPQAKLGLSYAGQVGSGVSDNGAKLDLRIRF